MTSEYLLSVVTVVCACGQRR